MRSRDYSSKKHIFRFISNFDGEIQTCQGYESNGGLLSCLLVGEGIEKIKSHAERVATFFSALPEMSGLASRAAIQSLESSTIYDLIGIYSV